VTDDGVNINLNKHPTSRVTYAFVDLGYDTCTSDVTQISIVMSHTKKS